MKPVKLRIQAFGPFAGQEEIDFSKLGKQPLFLINGPTGAGKSSILDAICFALYAHTTGAERDPQQMRCDHSDPSLLCEVTLDFSLGDKTYRISRSPIQEVAKSKGEGTTIKAAVARVWLLDGSAEGQLLVSKSVGEATRLITQLIGLGLDQFRQVMVLPQGKFRELLLADSANREAIFSQLFETHIYKKIENSLREQASSIKQAVAHHDSKVRGILEGADLASKEALDAELSALAPELNNAKALKDSAQSALQAKQRQVEEAITVNQQFTALASKEEALSATLSKQSEVDSQKAKLVQAKKAQDIHHLYANKLSASETFASAHSQYESAKKELSKTKQEHTLAQTAYNEAKAKASDIDKLKAQQNELQRFTTQLNELTEASLVLKQAQSKAAHSQSALAEKKQSIDDLKQELKTLEKQSVVQAQSLEALASKEQALSSLREKQSLRGQMAKLQKDIESQNKSIDEQQEKLTQAADLYAQSKTNAATTELEWHQGQAAILAKELKGNHPCPVCGSKAHPQPATLQHDASLVTKEQVEHARNQENKSRDSMQAIKDELATSMNKKDILQSTHADICERLGDYASMAEQAFNKHYEDIQQAVTNLVALKAAKSTTDKRISAIKLTLEQSDEALLSLEASANSSNNLLITAKTTVEQLRAQIPQEYQSGNELTEKILDVSATIEALNEALVKAEKRFSSKQSAHDQAIATEKALLEGLLSQERLRKKADENWQKALENSDFQNVEAFLNARLDDNTQTALTKAIEEHKSKLDSLHAVIKTLSQSLKGKSKADLTLLEEQLNEHKTVYNNHDKVWRELDARQTSLNAVNEKLRQAAKENEALNKQYSVIGTLDKVANGNTGNRISLQRFVLSVLLDDVLIQASQRLHKMSNGRYQLTRKEDKSKGRGASGLELEVQDGDTGKPRSVATLSGGESFMAALALALGVSDVVQSYAGGIRLDTLFIDEGFGSLDSESLDAAIRVLIDLQASGRMIGIISHVSELKEQMAKRIDVVSTRYGSSINTISS